MFSSVEKKSEKKEKKLKKCKTDIFFFISELTWDNIFNISNQK